ncbi:site-2 protease family protein [Phytohabitans sp. LJ34]|uniref:site-2 protease family protein n=1 Tax=Phytohabitans sp. LJ34 TaxID=3452217 RepID=UPI003F88F127
MIQAVVVAASAVLVAVAAHEAAHGFALRSLGIPVHRAGIGLPLPPVFTMFRVRGVTFTVSPWLVGAYVQAHPHYVRQIEELRFRDRAWFLNAGTVVNLILGFGAFAATAVLVGHPGYAIVACAFGVVTWTGRRIVAAYLIPAAAVPVLVFVIVALAGAWSRGETGAGLNGLPNLVRPGVAGAVEFLGLASFSLGALNALPLFGLDNGKVVDLLLHRWIPRWAVHVYRTTGLVAVAAMLLLAIGSDMWAAITAVAS